MVRLGGEAERQEESRHIIDLVSSSGEEVQDEDEEKNESQEQDEDYENHDEVYCQDEGDDSGTTLTKEEQYEDDAKQCVNDEEWYEDSVEQSEDEEKLDDDTLVQDRGEQRKGETVDLLYHSGERSDRPCDWPDGVREIDKNINPEMIKLKDTRTVGPCDCASFCSYYSCINAELAYFYDSSNCRLGSGCGNRLQTKSCLQLERGQLGYGVRATAKIKRGECIAHYSGVLSMFDYKAADTQVSDYALETSERGPNGAAVYIDAAPAGGNARFINLSCAPKAVFVEKRYR